jgi:hypothetical protein
MAPSILGNIRFTQLYGLNSSKQRRLKKVKDTILINVINGSLDTQKYNFLYYNIKKGRKMN